GEFIHEAAVHTHDRHRAALAAGAYGLAERDAAVVVHEGLLLDAVVPVLGAVAMGFHADTVDAAIGPTAARHFQQGLMHVGFIVVDHFGLAAGAGQPQPFGQAIDGDHALCAHQVGRADGHQPHSAAAPYGHDVARFDGGEVRAHIARGHGVRYEHCLIVAHAVGYLESVDLAVRHPYVFGMAAGVTAERVAVREDAGAGMAVRQFSHVGFGVGVVAARECLAQAVLACAARQDGYH